VTNAKFNEALARTLGRPAVVPVPAFALKVAFGELAGALLGGPQVRAAVLERAGFRFLHPTLAQALEEMLGRGPISS
jgi:NAD dependent epimerase/dehydratase family enzyme